MTFVMMGYTCLTASFCPFPDHLTNRLDLLTHAGVVIGTVFSLHFDKDDTEQWEAADQCLLRYGYSCASIWLFVIQLFFTIVPACLVLRIFLSGRSERAAKYVPSDRKKLDALLETLQETKPHPVWVDEISVLVALDKFDDVEVSKLHELIGAMAGFSGIRVKVRRRFGDEVTNDPLAHSARLSQFASSGSHVADVVDVTSLDPDADLLPDALAKLESGIPHTVKVEENLKLPSGPIDLKEKNPAIDYFDGDHAVKPFALVPVDTGAGMEPDTELSPGSFEPAWESLPGAAADGPGRSARTAPAL
jgi:hypothetical protein